MLLGDDIMVDESQLLRSMLDVHDRYGRSVLALMEVTRRRDLVVRVRRARGGRGGARAGAVDRGEAEEGRRAVEPRGDRPLRVHARRSSTRSTASSPGAGGELQLTDAIGLLNETQTVYGRTFTDGRYDIGQKVDFLRANVELALDRPDIGPELEQFLVELAAPARPHLSPHARRPAGRIGASPWIPLEDVQAEVLRVGRRRSRRRPIAARATRSGWCSAEPVVAGEPVPPFANTAMDGYAVRAADTAGATDDRAGAAHGRRRPARRPRADGPGRAGRGDPDHDRRADPGRRRRDRHGRAHRSATATTACSCRHAATPATTCAPPAATWTPGDAVFEPGTVLGPAHLGVIASLGLGRGLGVPAGTGRRALHRRRAARGPGRARAGPDPRLEPSDAARDARRPRARAGRTSASRATTRRTSSACSTTRSSRCDAVITSGGVSVGDYDVVKAVLDRLGVLQWWQVAIKPAKPFAFGAAARRAAVRAARATR